MSVRDTTTEKFQVVDSDETGDNPGLTRRDDPWMLWRSSIQEAATVLIDNDGGVDADVRSMGTRTGYRFF